MVVKRWMSRFPVILGPRLPCQDALAIGVENAAHFMLVVDGDRAEALPREQEGGLSLVSSQLLSTPADPGFWLRFRCGPVLTYSSTLRSGPRESLARSQAWRAGS